MKISGLTRGKMTFRGGARKMGRSHMALARATSSTTTGRSSKISGWVKWVGKGMGVVGSVLASRGRLSYAKNVPHLKKNIGSM